MIALVEMGKRGLAQYIAAASPDYPDIEVLESMPLPQLLIIAARLTSTPPHAD